MKTPMQKHIDFMQNEITLIKSMPNVHKKMRAYEAAMTICINNAKKHHQHQKLIQEQCKNVLILWRMKGHT